MKQIASGVAAESVNCASAALFEVGARTFLSAPALAEEVFGPSSLVVRCRDIEELTEVVNRLDGQLAATLHLEGADYPAARRLLPILERRAGRIVVNGWPTGVEVCHAMVHGGPYPATSDSRGTSVGTLAIDRFLRPVCYQDVPQELLPTELRSADKPNLPALVDGTYRPHACASNE
jgi:NADP-dependent aldehyde dehydrogenase